MSKGQSNPGMRAVIRFTTEGRTLARLTGDCGYCTGARHIFSAGDAARPALFKYIRVPSRVRWSRSHSHAHHVSPSIQSTAPSGGRSARTIERSTDLSPLRGRHASLVSIVLPRSMTSFAWNRPECEKSNRIFCDAMVFPSEFEDKILPV